MGNFLAKASLIVVVGSMAIFCALAVQDGVEVLAKSAQSLYQSL